MGDNKERTNPFIYKLTKPLHSIPLWCKLIQMTYLMCDGLPLIAREDFCIMEVCVDYLHTLLINQTCHPKLFSFCISFYFWKSIYGKDGLAYKYDPSHTMNPLFISHSSLYPFSPPQRKLETLREKEYSSSSLYSLNHRESSNILESWKHELILLPPLHSFVFFIFGESKSRYSPWSSSLVGVEGRTRSEDSNLEVGEGSHTLAQWKFVQGK